MERYSDAARQACCATKFADKIKAIPQATIIPVGKAVELALQNLIDQDIISRGRCLFGFPHPSGTNRHRARMFAQRLDRLAQQLHEQFSTPQ